MDKSKKLIIVESPAKAKTIARFLGSEYVVEASIGHIRDLPQRRAQVPDKYKEEKWAELGVDVENGFRPIYIVPPEKQKQVSKLKAAMKGASSILLATDEDREGESISWHILQVLAPKKDIDVKRIVFHEVTKEAIQEALRNPRSVNESLVRAQESRRVLDRLFGWTLSPLLWSKVQAGLSAGRVQSVAVRLAVERERERKAFVPASYWDVVATLKAEKGTFKARLTRVADRQVADGKSFASTGELIKKHEHLDEKAAQAIADRIIALRPWTITNLVESEGKQNPSPPFTTSTLQQEANRKLRFTAKRTMHIAQDLYEGIELGGERVGLITYMRTDSLTLAEKAIAQCREVIRDMFGAEYLPSSAPRYKTKSKGAQEAHEAIRPTDLSRTPESVKRFLNDDQSRLYELIWKRTVASQMVPARIKRTQVETTVEDLIFSASGKQILFPGFLRAYVEGSDDPEAEIGDQEAILPELRKGEEVEPLQVEPDGHETKAPARYTEASLVKKLEEEGIGRPSTYATVIATIQERGYIFKRRNELIPTFTAFVVTQLLEKHFDDLVDLKFTAHMEDELDDVASGSLAWDEPLREFYFGKKNDGLVQRVKEGREKVGYESVAVSDDIVIKVGKFGPYVQRGEGGPGNIAGVPEETAPAELTEEAALELLAARDNPEEIATETPGRTITMQKGRYGDYLQVSENGEKRNVSLPPGVAATDVTPEMAEKLATLPRTIGKDPASGEEISAAIGRYGPYVKRGSDFRNLDAWERAVEISLDEALEILAQPKTGGRTAARAAIKEVGGIKVMAGRYGPYVTDGETNATIPKTIKPEDIDEATARELLKARKESAPAKKTRRRKKRS